MADTNKIKIFHGAYTKQMPLIVKEGFNPATVSDVIKLLLKGELSFDESHHTVSAIAYSGDKQDKFKIIHFSQELKNVSPETELYHGGIKLTQEQYDKIKAKEFSRKEMKQEGMEINEKLLDEKILKHKGWLELVPDKNLLKQIMQKVFLQVHTKYKEKKAMGFFILGPQEVPSLHCWFLEKLDLYSRFSVVGSYDLPLSSELTGINFKP